MGGLQLVERLGENPILTVHLDAFGRGEVAHCWSAASAEPTVAAAPGSAALAELLVAGFGAGGPSGFSSDFTAGPPSDQRRLSEASTFST
jgi:hypothetical protein